MVAIVIQGDDVRFQHPESASEGEEVFWSAGTVTHLARILAPISSFCGSRSDIKIIRYKGQAEVVEKLHGIEKGGLPRSLALSADELIRVLKRPDTVLLFATSGSPSTEVLGYILAFQNRLALHLSRLVVAEPYRRRGIAKKLILEALSSTKKSCATLHVDPQNQPAVSLYQSLGFQLDGVLEDYYRAGKSAHKLRKHLL